MADLIDKGHYTALTRMDPTDVCKRALCTYDKSLKCYTLPVLQHEYSIYPENGRITSSAIAGEPHEYLALFAIHYLLTAREISPAGSWISEKDMPGGVTFFRGPHEIPTNLITNRVNNSLEAFKNLCINRGGTPLEMADAAFVFQVTQRISIAILYWEGDDEFPAEAKILYDGNLPRHFALDIVYALAVGICNELGDK
jgi:hypothetical protein